MGPCWENGELTHLTGGAMGGSLYLSDWPWSKLGLTAWVRGLGVAVFMEPQPQDCAPRRQSREGRRALGEAVGLGAIESQA